MGRRLPGVVVDDPCPVCKETGKEFGFDASRATGHAHKCKECQSLDFKNRRPRPGPVFCRRCGVWFSPLNNANMKYCCTRCKKRSPDAVGIKGAPAICCECGGEYRLMAPRQATCSTTCRRRHNLRRDRRHKRQERETLSPAYVYANLKSTDGITISRDGVPSELIEAKRELIKLRRRLRQ